MSKMKEKFCIKIYNLVFKAIFFPLTGMAFSDSLQRSERLSMMVYSLWVNLGFYWETLFEIIEKL